MSISELRASTTSHAARFILVGVLMAAPLAFGAVQPWAWAGLATGVFAALSLWALSSLKLGSFEIGMTPLYGVLLWLLLLIVAQRIRNVSFDPMGAHEAAVKLVLCALVFFLARELFPPQAAHPWSRLGLAVTVYLFAIALLAILQFFSSPDLIYWTRRPLWGGTVFGPYVNHNHYAGLLEILIPIGLAYILSSRHGARSLLFFAIVIAIASVLLSGSRGGILSLIVEFTIFCALIPRQQRESKRARAAILAGLSFAAAALVTFLWFDPGNVISRLEQTATSPRMSVADRRLYAADALRMFRDYPLMGIGAGSFEAAYPAYQSFSSDLVVNHVHNDYLEALAELGIVGFALILIALFLFLRKVFFEHSVGSAAVHWVGTGAAVGCCGLLVHSFSDFNLHIPANAAWFAFAAGLATASRPIAKRGPGQKQKKMRPKIRWHASSHQFEACP